jgi:tetratricopeptide (TPR) repeat protein
MGFFDRFERFLDDVIFLPDDVRESLATADAALEAELFEEASTLYREILATRPLPRALVGLAHARRGIGDRDGMLEALAEARRALPEDAELALWMARACLDAERHADAVTAARDAARLVVSDGGEPFAEACTLAARAEQRGGRPDRAVRELRKALASAPTPERRVLLVEVLASAGHVGAARSAALELTPDELDAGVALRLGRALVEIGALDAAEPILESASAKGAGEAGVALSGLALGRGDTRDAELRARRAIASGVGAPAFVALANALAAEARDDDAAEALLVAASMAQSPTLLARAATTAPRETLRAWIERGELAPSDALEELRAFAEGHDVGTPTTPRGWLAHAMAALDRSAPTEALTALDAWDVARATVEIARSDEALAAELRRRALRAAWRTGEDLDLAAAIDAVTRFSEEHALSDVARRARALRDELDRPLLLAVLGEFNAGKSTLINAFIGAEVAPMGIVPTTATLNVLRGGAERRVRLVLHDGSTREGGYEQLAALLEEAESTGVDRAEIVLPSETLERVWILDAPGTNALDPKHEELAKEAARRADAVLWIFDAAQAGKQSETRMHQELRARGRLVVPVLNKVDRLKPGELDEVCTVVRAGFGAEPLAVSARKALRARVTGDDVAYTESGFPRLLEALDAIVFGRARELKRAACAGRLAEALEAALSTEQERAERHVHARTVALDARERLLRLGPDLLLAIDDALRAYERELDEAFEAAAHEVLGFVRPRASRLSRHGAHAEDRAFLADLLERRLRDAIERCERRLLAQARARLAQADGEGDEVTERLRTSLRTALATHWGYQRGVLEGGALRRFFDEVLPRAELDVAVLGTALARGRVDSRAELRPALVEALELVQRERVEAREGEVRALDDARRREAERVFGPLRALHEVLREVAPKGRESEQG